jgi:hypothetical protein
MTAAEAERKAHALLEPYCANPLMGDLRLAITATVRADRPHALRRGCVAGAGAPQDARPMH